MVRIDSSDAKVFAAELPDALKDLAEISKESNFSYISQKLNSPSSEKLLFRIRIGFFETKRDAQRKIYVLKKKLPQMKGFKTMQL